MNRLKQLTLLLGDLLALYIGLFFALAARFWQWPGQALIDLVGPLSLLFFVAVVIIFIVGLYDVGRAKNGWIFYQKLMLSAGIWFTLSIVYFYITPNNAVTPKTILFLTTMFSFGIIAIWRFFYNRFLSAALWQTRVIFAGFTPEVTELCEVINNEPGRGFVVAGLIIAAGETIPPSLSNIPSAASLDELKAKFNISGAELIILAPHLAADKKLLQNLYQAIFNQCSVLNLEDFFEDIFKRVPPFVFSESWFITNLQEQKKKIYDRFRILTDYIAAVLMTIFFVITFPFIAALIKLTSRGPIFFKQTRVGRGGINFTMYKYRTMRSLSGDGSAELSGPQYAAHNDTRITGLGKFLRRTRLDEVPQCLNILKGQMSIIGPRPERPEFVTTLTAAVPFYALRHLIKPGLTGWAQLQHAYYGNIDENLRKLEYDLYYVKNRGPLLDLAIALRTVNILLRMIGR